MRQSLRRKLLFFGVAKQLFFFSVAKIFQESVNIRESLIALDLCAHIRKMKESNYCRLTNIKQRGTLKQIPAKSTFLPLNH